MGAPPGVAVSLRQNFHRARLDNVFFPSDFSPGAMLSEVAGATAEVVHRSFLLPASPLAHPALPSSSD